MNGPDPIESLEQLAQRVNAVAGQTGVDAYFEFDGTLTLRNSIATQQSAAIVFGPEQGAIASLSGQVNPRLVIEAQRNAGDLETREVALTLGANGSFKDLAKLGMPGAVVMMKRPKISLFSQRVPWALRRKLQQALSRANLIH